MRSELFGGLDRKNIVLQLRFFHPGAAIFLVYSTEKYDTIVAEIVSPMHSEIFAGLDPTNNVFQLKFFRS